MSQRWPVLAAALWAWAGAAQEPPAGAELPLLPDSRFTVQGTSNKDPFTCHFEKASGTARLAAGAPARDGLPEPSGVEALEVSVPVATIDCKNDVMMAKARRTLRAAEHPDIRFRLQSLEAQQQQQRKDRVQLLARGELTVAGQTRPVELPAELARGKKDTLQVTGSVPLSFRDYGMEPPTELFGALRVHDQVTVKFDLRFAGAPTQR